MLLSIVATGGNPARADERHDDQVLISPTPGLSLPRPEEFVPDQPPLHEQQEQLALPPVPPEVMDYVQALLRQFEGDPRFNTAGISLDRKSVPIWWYGEPSEELRHAMRSAPAGISAEVIGMAHSAAELRKAIDEIMIRGGSAGIQGVGHRPDGALITVMVHPSDPMRFEEIRALVDEITTIPVEITEGGVIPLVLQRPLGAWIAFAAWSDTTPKPIRPDEGPDRK